MSIRIQQPTGALHIERILFGGARVTVDHFRGRESIELSRSELYDLYLQLAVLLVEKHD